MSVWPRVALVLVSLVVGAWLTHALRAADLEAEGQAAVERARPKMPREELVRARDSLHRAERLNPDQGPLLTEGQLLLAAGRREEGYDVAVQLTATEPEDFNAWLLLYHTAPTNDRVEAARLRVKALNPWLGDRLESYGER